MTVHVEPEPLDVLAAELLRAAARVNPALARLRADRQAAVGKVMTDAGLKAPAVGDSELPRLIDEGQNQVRALLSRQQGVPVAPRATPTARTSRPKASGSGLSLIVIGYDNHDQAVAAYNEVFEMQGDFVLELQGVAIVNVDSEGTSHVETPRKIVGMSAASGALWGMLIGLLFFVPFFGLALGGLMGALFGKLGKSGINDEFRAQVNGLLEPGHSAVVIMASNITEDKFAYRIGKFGGRLLKTSLSDEEEQELAHELGDTDLPRFSF